MKKQHPLAGRVRAAGLRATPGRLALATLLQNAHQPLGTPELARHLVPQDFDLATLYRTLRSFESGALVRQVALSTAHASYEWVEHAGEHHHHLVCQQCRKVAEIPECDLDALEKRVLKGAKDFASVESHSLEFFGLCRACTRKS
jgi:Fe2+ or Zn2+ uptake regulation protein